MSPRVFHALVAALIRIGLLLALVIMLMAENAQAQPVQTASAWQAAPIGALSPVAVPPADPAMCGFS